LKTVVKQRNNIEPIATQPTVFSMTVTRFVLSATACWDHTNSFAVSLCTLITPHDAFGKLYLLFNDDTIMKLSNTEH